MSTPAVTARKRAVNLTLSESLVAQARSYTGNLSATIEELLAAYVVEQQQMGADRRRLADTCVADWNAAHDKLGSFADGHSTL